MKKTKKLQSFKLVASTLVLAAGSMTPLLSQSVAAQATGATGLNDKISFQSNRSSRSSIYISGVDGSNAAVLASAGSGSDYFTSWSPDGTKFAFSSSRGGNEDVYVANADGSNPVNITNDAATDTSPAWSPDGTKIAFTSTRNSNEDVYVMNTDGTNVQRLTTDSNDDYEAAWSPDGTKIAFTSNRDGDNDIFVMDADGSNQTNLTTAADTGNSGDTWPSWSPYGNQIAFNSDRGSSNDIFVMDADGSNLTNLTNTASTNEFGPAWSPDGTKIAYTGVVTDEEVFVMNADGTNQTNISNDSGNQDQYPAWKPIPFPSTVNNVTTVNDGQSYTGADYVVENGETLVVNGSVGNVAIMSGGTLKGHGSVASITSLSGGHVSPGNSPGCLTSNGDAIMNSGSNLDIEIGGTTVCSQYDQLKVNGAVNMDGIKINATLYNGFVPTVGQSYTIIDNDGSDAVTGTFQGVAEGGSFENDGVTYRVTYVGGSGNDVVLTVTAIDASKLPKAPNTGLRLIAAHPLTSLIVSAMAAAALLHVSRRLKPAKR